MATYAQHLKSARASKVARKMTPKYTDFKTVGQVIVGRYVGAVDIQGKRSTGTYKQYTFETDEGLMKFHCGGYFDRDQGQLMVIGGVYAITFKGTKEIEGGNSVNDYETEELPSDIEVTPPTAKGSGNAKGGASSSRSA